LRDSNNGIVRAKFQASGEVTNTPESVERAFYAVITAVENIGVVEHDSSWAYDSESAAKHYIKYLDDVLENMAYDAVKDYITLLRKNIDSIDQMSISRNRQLELERVLNSAFPDTDYKTRRMLSYYSDKQFPLEIPSEYDKREYVLEVLTGINNFSAWEAFFRGENRYLTDFFVLNEIKRKLYALIDDVPQRYAPSYRSRLDVFVAGWGL
jgi:hypothetical protein